MEQKKLYAMQQNTCALWPLLFFTAPKSTRPPYPRGPASVKQAASNFDRALPPPSVHVFPFFSVPPHMLHPRLHPCLSFFFVPPHTPEFEPAARSSKGFRSPSPRHRQPMPSPRHRQLRPLPRAAASSAEALAAASSAGALASP